MTNPPARAVRQIQHYGWTLVLFLAGLVVDNVPRRFLPDRFVAWYNRGLDTWTWDPPSRLSEEEQQP